MMASGTHNVTFTVDLRNAKEVRKEEAMKIAKWIRDNYVSCPGKDKCEACENAYLAATDIENGEYK